MSSKIPDSTSDNGSGASRLLSKVVKFVKSPTTHWADLDRPQQTDAPDTESRLALKEMIKRKRRNDFVRDRELDTLRKLRRKELLKDGGALSGQTFSYPNNEHPADTDARAKTVEKIDVIEAQMAKSWFHQSKAPQAAASPGGARTAAASHDAFDSTSHGSGVSPSVAAAVPQDRSMTEWAFAPTELMSGEGAQDREPAHAEAPPASAPAPVATATAAEPLLAGSGVYGGLGDFQVEVLADAKLDPALEEAAIRFANGDIAGAEAGLRDLVADDGGRKDDVYTWLTLFDLYRVTGEQDKFDDMALQFAARFGRSAPQWGVDVNADAQASARWAPVAEAAGVAARFHWSSQPDLGAKSVAVLNAAVARSASPWRIDWRRLKTIEPEALAALNETFERWVREPVQIQFLGAENLLKVLADNSPADQRQIDPLWWRTRLALLRVMGEMDEFELVALNYCVTYEVSPPAWEAPKNTYSATTEKGEVLASEDSADSAHPAVLAPDVSGFKLSDLSGADGHVNDGVARSELSGTLLGTVDASTFGRLRLTDATRSIELNCRNLQRVDFGAAGDLLNWAMSQKDAHRPVSFKQVNRLVAAFFGVIGITDTARVVLRTD